jgi:hypothetical protein
MDVGARALRNGGIPRRDRPRLPTNLAHVPKKLLDFFDSDMLQLFEIERFLFDHVIPHDREAL